MGVREAQAMEASGTTVAPAVLGGLFRSRWARLVSSPFELGQRDYAGLARSSDAHELLLHRSGGPLAVQIGVVVGLIALTGGGTRHEVRVGLAVAGGAVVVGLALIA